MTMRTFLAVIVLVAATFWLFAVPGPDTDVTRQVVLPVVLVSLLVGSYLLRSALRFGGGRMARFFLWVTLLVLAAFALIPAQVEPYLQVLLPAYTMVNLEGGYEWNKTMRLNLAVNNVLDRPVYLFAKLPGRNATAELVLSF